MSFSRFPRKLLCSALFAFAILWGSLIIAPTSGVQAVDPTPTPTATATATVTPTPTITATVTATPTFTPVPASATKPVATVSPTTVTFGSVTQGTTSANQTVTLTNTGGANLNFLTAPELKGGEVDDFSIGPNSCGTAAPLAPGTSCTVVVRFNPARNANGNRSTTLLFRDDSLTGSPQFVTLSGIATVNTPTAVSSIGISFAPTTINFGSQPIGVVSGSQFVVVTNTGANDLTISSIGKSGGDSQDFSNPSTNCLTTLSPGAQCQLSVTFNPTTSGNRSSTIIVTDNAPTDGSTQVIVISGIGTGAASPPPTPTVASAPLPTPTAPVPTTVAVSPTSTIPPRLTPTSTPIASPTTPTAPVGATPSVTATVFLPGLPNTGTGSQRPLSRGSVDWLAWSALCALLVGLGMVYHRRIRKG